MISSRSVLAAISLPIALALPGKKHNYWPGWKGIDHLFVFGDSYSTVGFNDTLTQPNPANPMGNPAYPGCTITNGANWVDFLTYTWNATYLETINLAVSGATVDNKIIPGIHSEIPSLKSQIEKYYLPTYSSHPSFFNWTADSTLFATFFGINDVTNSYMHDNVTKVLPKANAKYGELLDKLYQSGARNFLILEVPPVNRSPGTLELGTAEEQKEAMYISQWNANSTRIAANLSSTYADAKTFVFNTNQLFDRILNNPCSHAATCALKNTTGYCAAYENGTPNPYYYSPKCTYPVDEYFWLNTLHPTFRVHNATAQAISKMLSR